MLLKTATSQLSRRLMSTEANAIKHTNLFNSNISPPRQAWLETFIGQDSKKLKILQLHPKIFGVFPRPDHITACVQWQRNYRKVNYLCMPTRNELPGGTSKPWPQKGTGRARHGSVNSPIFRKGGWARGPRGPNTSFYVLPHGSLVNGLLSTLTIKLAQDDLKIVDSIDNYESDDPKLLEKQFKERLWGPSVLIVDNKNSFPEQLEKATSGLTHINMMPLFATNVLSLIKHETVIMTQSALREIEDKLLFQLTRVDLINVCKQESKL